MEVALGLSGGRPPNPFLVGLAVLNLLSEAAEQQPLLCLVDDAQWLDSASARVLAFVARRLLAERIAMVFAAREPLAALDGFAVLQVRPLGLLLGIGVGRLCAFGGLLSGGGLLRHARPGFGAMRSTLSRFRRFPLLATPSALLNSAGLEAPLLVISAFYGDARAGLLGLTIRVFSGPTLVIGQAIDEVFSGESSAAIRNPRGTLRSLVRSTVQRLLLIGVAPAVILGLFGPWLFGVIFGPGWTEAGVYAQLLALPYLLQFAVNPVSGVLLYLDRQDQMLGWSAARLVLTAGGPAACAVVGAPITVAIAFLAIGHVVCYGLLYVLCARAVSAADDKYRRDRP